MAVVYLGLTLVKDSAWTDNPNCVEINALTLENWKYNWTIGSVTVHAQLCQFHAMDNVWIMSTLVVMLNVSIAMSWKSWSFGNAMANESASLNLVSTPVMETGTLTAMANVLNFPLNNHLMKNGSAMKPVRTFQHHAIQNVLAQTGN